MCFFPRDIASSDIHNSYMYTGKSHITSNKDILYRRPPGGVAILYIKIIYHKICHIHTYITQLYLRGLYICHVTTICKQILAPIIAKLLM